MTKLVECMRKRVRQFIAVKWVFSCREKKCNLLSFTNVSHTFLIDDFFLKTLEAKKMARSPWWLFAGNVNYLNTVAWEQPPSYEK